jgi:hypothetical protein
VSDSETLVIASEILNIGRELKQELERVARPQHVISADTARTCNEPRPQT